MYKRQPRPSPQTHTNLREPDGGVDSSDGVNPQRQAGQLLQSPAQFLQHLADVVDALLSCSINYPTATSARLGDDPTRDVQNALQLLSNCMYLVTAYTCMPAKRIMLITNNSYKALFFFNQS